MTINTAFLMTSLLIGSLLSTISLAKPPHGEPPQEAIDICMDKEEGEKVSFETPRGDTLEASCTRKDGQLIAMPDKSHRRG